VEEEEGGQVVVVAVPQEVEGEEVERGDN